MRRARFALISLSVGAVTPQARAEATQFAWHGPDCASHAPLLERRLAALVEPRDRERLAGSVAVTRSGNRYAVELSIDLDGRPLGSRRFQAASCERAAETAAVAASLAVYDGGAEPPAAADSGIRSDIWTRSPEPTPDFSRARPTPPPPSPRLEGRVGLLGLVEMGALPQPAWGGALALELGVGRRWSFGMLGSVTAEQERAVQLAQAVQLSLWSGAARACVASLLGARHRLDGCAGARLEQARGRGQGFDVNRSASLTWAAPLVGVNLSLRGPRFVEWRLELEGSLPLSRRRFLVDGSEVSRAAALVGAARLGALLRF